MADECRCPHCGFPVDEIRELREQLAIATEQIRNDDDEFRRLRTIVTTLRKDRQNQQSAHPMYDEAWQVFEYWRERISPHAKEFSGERFDFVAARLSAGWTVDDLKLAIDGAREHPRAPGSKTDLKSICRNETNLQMFLDWAPRPGTGDPALEQTYETLSDALTADLTARLCELRGWTPEAVAQLGLGFESESKRVVFPIRDESRTLVGFSLWLPNPATRGTRHKNIAKGPRQLFPPPEQIEEGSIWLVEGEPDAVSMWSIGQPATSVPGVATWKAGWERRFERFDRVRILFDCDEEGRKAAAARAKALSGIVDDVQMLDLDPGRTDHYDIGDLVLEHGVDASTVLAQLEPRSVQRLVPKGFRLQPGRETRVRAMHDPRPPVERVLEALDKADCRPRRGSGDGQYEARCPNHDDRNPSLSIGVGDDGRCLLHCHAGCEPGQVVAALGKEWSELFDRTG